MKKSRNLITLTMYRSFRIIFCHIYFQCSQTSFYQFFLKATAASSTIVNLFPKMTLTSFGQKTVITKVSNLNREMLPNKTDHILKSIYCNFWNLFWCRLSKFEIQSFFWKKWANPGLFRLCLSFSHYNFNDTNWKSIDGGLGIQTSGCRMVGADETTEIWQPPKSNPFCHKQCDQLKKQCDQFWRNFTSKAKISKYFCNFVEGSISDKQNFKTIGDNFHWCKWSNFEQIIWPQWHKKSKIFSVFKFKRQKN